MKSTSDSPVVMFQDTAQLLEDIPLVTGLSDDARKVAREIHERQQPSKNPFASRLTRTSSITKGSNGGGGYGNPTGTHSSIGVKIPMSRRSEPIITPPISTPSTSLPSVADNTPSKPSIPQTPTLSSVSSIPLPVRTGGKISRSSSTSLMPQRERLSIFQAPTGLQPTGLPSTGLPPPGLPSTGPLPSTTSSLTSATPASPPLPKIAGGSINKYKNIYTIVLNKL